MSLYRSFLWCLLLAAAGALSWQLLRPDVGDVLIRWHGLTISTTVAFFLFANVAFLFALWFLWSVLRLPYHAWQTYAKRQARNRLNHGLMAFYEGRYSRALQLLMKAAEQKSVRDIALLMARQTALAQENVELAEKLLAQLNISNPSLAATDMAREQFHNDDPQRALDALLSRPASEWSPFARAIAVESAIALQQFDLAQNWLNAKNHGLSAKQHALLANKLSLHDGGNTHAAGGAN